MENQHQLIKGYRDLSAAEIAAMNAAKLQAEKVGQLVDRLTEEPGVDQRWLAIAKTDLQKGFMSLVRAIARPESF